MKPQVFLSKSLIKFRPTIKIKRSKITKGKISLNLVELGSKIKYWIKINMVKSAIITFEKANAFNVVLQINMVNKLFEQHFHSSLAVANRSRKQLKILFSLTLRL
jgi:hypothetical protein